MNITTMKTRIQFATQTPGRIPKTGRGRALYTVDWFLHGKRVLRNHDHRRITLKTGFYC